MSGIIALKAELKSVKTGFDVSQDQFLKALGDDWGESSGRKSLRLVVGGGVCVCGPDTQATTQTGNEHVLQNKSIKYLMPS